MLQPPMDAMTPRLPVAEPDQDRVLILDFGSQVTQLIARRVREAGTYCEIWPFTAESARIEAFAPRAVILSGGPASVTAPDSPRVPQRVFEHGPAGAGHLLRPAADVRPARRRGRGERAARVRPRLDRRHRPVRAAGRRLGAGRARAGVDEPWRPRHRAAARLHAGGHQRGCALRGDRRRRAALLRRAVPPRGGAHAARRRPDRQLPAPGGMPRHLDHGGVPRQPRSPASAPRWGRAG